MAKAVATVVTEGIIDKLLSLVADEINNLAWGFKAELRKLQNILKKIQVVVKEAETMQVKNENVKDWLMKLRDVAYEADDVLDEYATEILRRKMEIRKSMKKKVCNFFSPYSNPVAFRLRMAHEIRKINVKLDGIDKEKNRFQFSSSTNTTSITSIQKGKGVQETYAFLDDIADLPIVGRDKDKSKIINNLQDCCGDEVNVSVLPIVGIGGLGKTTLAQLAFNDESINQHFDLKMWVRVSNIGFDVKRVGRLIIESATKNSCNLENWDMIVRKIRESLGGKRYLLVLDDVWNEDESEWNQLRKCLGDAAKKGSKILVTTRSEKVASVVRGEPLMHRLEALSDKDCWSIFQRRAFAIANKDENADLEKIGIDLVKRCKGVPLAVKALGGLLRTKRSKEEWELVRDDEIWKQYRNDNAQIMAALKLSYDDLPYHLKQCFAYCSVFPKDYVIYKHMLIWQWIAHGFVVGEANDEVSLEDTAEKYFSSLLGRSFFQDVERDEYSGEIRKCKMHDLMHDLAQSVNGDECCVIDQLSSNSSSNSSINDDDDEDVHQQQNKLRQIVHEKARHLSVVAPMGSYPEPRTIVELLSSYVGAGGGRRLRTILLLRDICKIDYNLFDYMSLNLKCLRVLDLSRRYDENREVLVSPEIGRLKHLRYLNLSCTDIEDLPDSITNLYNLQTLLLSGCRNLKQLPRDMRKMINLRHLVGMLGQLTNLQTLWGFVIGSTGEFGHLLSNHLRQLGIVFKGDWFHNLNLHEQAISGAKFLKDKHHLRQLGLLWEGNSSIPDGVGLDIVNDVLLEALEPHSNLKYFFLIGFPGIRLPSWITKIERVVIVNCPNLAFLQDEEEEEERNQNSNLVSLNALWMEHCPNLRSLWEGIQGFTSLKRLCIRRCPYLTRRYNRQTGQDWNKIAHIPDVQI
uniref:Disease resistance protein RGA3 n=1 Tax=Nelumbo nucifera TaxID=4432 RepID=A0A822ZJJ0_NELNU|nr:TPA_asm: hypothetical protein HUJ06_004474 [Nelumbo nucifera]